MRLYREIEAKGYAYCSSNVSRFVAQLRREEASGQRVAAGAPRTPSRVPTARKVAGLYLRRPEDLKPEEHIYLRRLTETSPELATAYRLTQDFALMVRERQDSMLDGWLAEAEACEVSVLRRFAKGIREDLAAVRAGLREEWSNGRVAYCTSSPAWRPVAEIRHAWHAAAKTPRPAAERDTSPDYCSRRLRSCDDDTNARSFGASPQAAPRVLRR